MAAPDGGALGATLVLGYGLHPDADAVAERVAAERGARIVRAGADPGVPLTALGAYQRRNFALARAAAEAYLGELDPGAVATAAAETLVPGRLQVVDSEPVTVLDGAHNPEGMAALAEALDDPFAAGRRPIVAVISVLDDKDASAMLATLIPKCDALVLTASQNPRALPPPTLKSLAGQVGNLPSEVIRDPHGALARAREIAGPDGLVLATGSIYLVADLLRPAGAGRASML
jgi:dihydrofolate synthase/folylpolyglutamate synthase